MRSFIVVVVLFASVVAMAAPATQPAALATQPVATQPAATRTVQVREFTLEVPANWREVSELKWESRPFRGEAAAFSIEGRRHGGGVGVAVRELLESLKGCEGFDFGLRRETKVDGKEAVELNYEVKARDRVYSFVHTVWQDRGTVYHAVGVVLGERAKWHAPVFRGIVGSIRVR